MIDREILVRGFIFCEGNSEAMKINYVQVASRISMAKSGRERPYFGSV